MIKNTLAFVFLFISISSQSQTLKLEEIMKGDAFIG